MTASSILRCSSSFWPLLTAASTRLLYSSRTRRASVRTTFSSSSGGSLAAIQELACDSHLLFDEFLFLAGFALPVGQRLKFEQARIVGEFFQGFVSFSDSKFDIVLRQRLFDLSGEALKVFAFGFLLP